MLYTAHSIPLAMADHCRYAAQFAEAARLVSEAPGLPDYESSIKAAAARRASHGWNPT